jgi:hypothetical protein
MSANSARAAPILHLLGVDGMSANIIKGMMSASEPSWYADWKLVHVRVTLSQLPMGWNWPTPTILGSELGLNVAAIFYPVSKSALSDVQQAELTKEKIVGGD